MTFEGVSFNIENEALYKKALNDLKQSLVPGVREHFFAADNIITWNRNFSFFTAPGFLDVIQSNSDTAVELSIMWRTYILSYFAKCAKKVEGDFIEAGAYKGTSAKKIIELTELYNTNKDFYLYDLFEHKEEYAHHSLEAHGPDLYEKVKKRFEEYDFVKVIKGYIPESFEKGFPEKIAFAHIDLNQAPAEAAALKRILPNLSPGGVIVLDDYGWHGYAAQKITQDPIFQEYGIEVLELPTGQGVAINSF